VYKAAVDERPHLFGMLSDDLQDWLVARGIDAPPEHARRVLAEVISRGVTELRPRRPLRRDVRLAVEEGCRWDRLEVVEKAEDPDDHFVKYLFRCDDGALCEAVRIPLHREGCYSICLSSQVGCAMGCTFCATARLGFERNLKAWEMIAAFVAIRDEAPGRVTGVVFQGQGEPLANYDAVIQAARILMDPCGGRTSGDAITISTVGLVPQIRRYAREGHKFRLIVSLTSAIPERRAELLPVAGRYSLEELADAIREYAASGGFGRTTIAWVMLGGVNTGQDEADALAALLGDVRLRVNIIDVNDPRPDGYRQADQAELKAFIDRLQVLEAPIVRRYSGGQRSHAACGMLASVRQETDEEATSRA
jgi:23S rRNA (adenine2503-C2)-methyltransferase